MEQGQIALQQDLPKIKLSEIDQPPLLGDALSSEKTQALKEHYFRLQWCLDMCAEQGYLNGQGINERYFYNGSGSALAGVFPIDANMATEITRERISIPRPFLTASYIVSDLGFFLLGRLTMGRFTTLDEEGNLQVKNVSKFAVVRKLGQIQMSKFKDLNKGGIIRYTPRNYRAKKRYHDGYRNHTAHGYFRIMQLDPANREINDLLAINAFQNMLQARPSEINPTDLSAEEIRDLAVGIFRY